MKYVHILILYEIRLCFKLNFLNNTCYNNHKNICLFSVHVMHDNHSY